jgi:hypothetical protein
MFFTIMTLNKWIHSYYWPMWCVGYLLRFEQVASSFSWYYFTSFILFLPSPRETCKHFSPLFIQERNWLNENQRETHWNCNREKGNIGLENGDYKNNVMEFSFGNFKRRKFGHEKWRQTHSYGYRSRTGSSNKTDLWAYSKRVMRDQ